MLKKATHRLCCHACGCGSKCAAPAVTLSAQARAARSQGSWLHSLYKSCSPKVVNFFALIGMRFTGSCCPMLRFYETLCCFARSSAHRPAACEKTTIPQDLKPLPLRRNLPLSIDSRKDYRPPGHMALAAASASTSKSTGIIIAGTAGAAPSVLKHGGTGHVPPVARPCTLSHLQTRGKTGTAW
jgi:hypothetical protein